MKFAKYLLPVSVLATIVLVCFGRTLGSYFVADDFTQIAYVSGICKGNLNALLSNFTGNYMQISVMKIYRPCLLLSLVFDYMLWHANAFGYFLTNIMSMFAVSLMLYLLLRELTKSWENSRSILFSLFSAALFASSPLHCESISFISGRDNIISAFFYLLSFWCFVRKGTNKSNILLTLGITSFLIAMLSKEMAIGLPIVLTGIGFFLPKVFQSSANQHSLKERIKLAVQISMPIWISTVFYLLIRFLALGTLTGGYTGGIGSGLMAHLIDRWTNTATIFRIIYPLNLEVFGTTDYYRTVLSVLYIVLVVLIFLKFVGSSYPGQWLKFLVLWTLTAAAPLYQLWGLGANLEGARFYFFLSIPLAIFIPLLMFAPLERSSSNANIAILGLNINVQKPEIIGTMILMVFIALNTSITYKNNIPWVHAGRQTKACLLAGQKLARSMVAGERVALLGLPKEIAGAHAIYNGVTFNTMMSYPFSETNYAEKFITFDPLFYGPPELVNTQRFKSVLAHPRVVGLFVWNEKTLTFDRLHYPSGDALVGKQPATSAKYLTTDVLMPDTIARSIAGSPPSHMSTASNNLPEIWIHDCEKCYGLLIAPLNIDPYQYDFIEFKLKTSLPKEPISVLWRGSRECSLDWYDSKHPVQKMAFKVIPPANIRIRLSDHWRWFTQGNINQLQLQFLPGQSVELSNIRLVSGRSLIPAIAVTNLQANNVGIYSIGRAGVALDFDASMVDGCMAVEIEISKPNYFFEGLSEEESKDATMITLVQPKSKGQLNIANKVFLSPGYYQLRALCLNDKGAPIGEKSDPVTIGAL